MKKAIYFLIGLIIINACANADKLIEQGDYDTAIEKLTNKLAGSKNKKQKHVLALEYAFQKAQEQDLQSEQSLQTDDDEGRWEKLQHLYSRIDSRQRKVKPLTPLYSSEGYQAGFRFINIEELKKENKKNLAEYYYKRAVELLDAASKNKDKAAARNAYDFLSKIETLYNTYKDVESLKRLAKERGIKYHLVTLINESATIMPYRVEDELNKISVNDLNTNWNSFDARINPAIQYDYKIKLRIREIQISPEREKTRVYDDTNEIEVEEDVYDSKGKPKKDSTGKTIKQKVKLKYVSTIEEVSQLKNLIIRGQIEWLDLHTNDVDYSRPIEVEAVFENYFAKLLRGNEKYVSKETKIRLGGRPIPFPSEEELLLDAADKLKRLMKERIREKR